jgi:PPIC-type PPIASE domain
MSVHLSVVALTAAAAAGCTTFSDNDAVARVGDVEMSTDELTERLSVLTSTDDPTLTALDDSGRADAEAARAEVSNWIRLQLLVTSELADRYTTDPSELGVTCLDVAIAADQADADTIKARLDGGEPWDEVVAPIEAAVGYESKQACQPLASYSEQLGDEVAARFAELKPGDAPEVVDAGGGGFAVIRIQEIADVDAVGLLTAVQGIDPDAVQALVDSASTADVYVDPRIGTFDAAAIDVVVVD